MLAEEISTKYFDYISSRKTFIAEASELPKEFYPLSKILNSVSSATSFRGFNLVSEKTGKKVLFTFTHTDSEEDGEEDVNGWWFESFNKEYKLLIIND